MILCEFTPPGEPKIYCAFRDWAHVHQWKSYLKSVASVKIAMPQRWGGYAAPTFSDLSFFPSMFAAGWDVPTNIKRPPTTAAIKLMNMDGEDEAVYTTIFEGTAQLASLPKDEVKYTLHRTGNVTKIPDATAYADTLNAVMATLCGPTLLNLTLNTTRARGTSPAVLHTTSGEQLTINFASELCQFFSHGFYIEGQTLYLVDMLDLAYGQVKIDEFDVQPCDYSMAAPISVVKCGDFSVTGSLTYGDNELSISKAFHTTEANVLAALTDILEIAERHVITLNSKDGQLGRKICGTYYFHDESRAGVLDSISIIHDIVYNFDEGKLQATGTGILA